jgi:hypothetical protein
MDAATLYILILCAGQGKGAACENVVMSGLGQTRTIRACPLHVRFTPLSGRMLKRVSMTALGQKQ